MSSVGIGSREFDIITDVDVMMDVKIRLTEGEHYIIPSGKQKGKPVYIQTK